MLCKLVICNQPRSSANAHRVPLLVFVFLLFSLLFFNDMKKKLARPVVQYATN